MPRLSALELLDVSSTEIDDAGLIHVVNHCGRLRRLKISGCSKITDIGIRAIFEICGNLEIFDFSHNWKVSHNFWEALTIRSRTKLIAVGIAHTNLAPVFIDPLREFLFAETGNSEAVCGRAPIEAVDYLGQNPRGPIDHLIVMQILYTASLTLAENVVVFHPCARRLDWTLPFFPEESTDAAHVNSISPRGSTPFEELL